MTNEELYKALYSTETIYRPPLERESVFLEMSCGCSWGKCTFCDFARDEFKLFSVEQIKEKIKLLSLVSKGKKRLFALGANPFVMSGDALIEILEAINEFMPEIEEISMYARADDINRKSPKELKRLKELKLSDLHVGVESGSDMILKMCNKGISAEDMEKAFHTLDSEGIGYNLTSILGLGGKALWRENAIETAWLYSRVRPRSIWVMALKLWENTPMYDMVQKGHFEMLSPREMLLEELLMVENINMNTTGCYYVDSTAMKKYTIVGFLQEGKKSITDSINNILALEKQKPGT